MKDTKRREAIRAGAVPVTWEELGGRLREARSRGLDRPPEETAASQAPDPGPPGEELIRETGAELFGPAEAVFDSTRAYRYLLTRTWAPGQPLVWLMLNPSTASAVTDDPTIKRCAAFARREGAGGIIVVNLFAYRASRPADLARCPDPVGELNDEFIRQAVSVPGRMVIVAWGAHGPLRGRAAQVTRMFSMEGIAVWCLGTTKTGQPVHPLYQPVGAKLIRYEALLSA